MKINRIVSADALTISLGLSVGIERLDSDDWNATNVYFHIEHWSKAILFWKSFESMSSKSIVNKCVWLIAN